MLAKIGSAGSYQPSFHEVQSIADESPLANTRRSRNIIHRNGKI